MKRETYNSTYYKLRNSITKRDKNCVQCGEKANHRHHIIPLSRGGTNSMANLMFLCETCHQSKHRHKFTNKRKVKAC